MVVGFQGFQLCSERTMYADLVEKPTRASVHDRLEGSTVIKSGLRRQIQRQITGKRERQDDDKWEHDLYKDDDSRPSNRRVGAEDLRLKLLKKSGRQAIQSADQVISRVTDLRRKLSGSVRSPSLNKNPPKPKEVVEASKPVKKSATVEAPEPETKKDPNSVPKKKRQRKVESVDNFLQSLGLEKYSITFQAEEVDMTALVHMTEEDLKAVGVPMGPRKKILSALESRA